MSFVRSPRALVSTALVVALALAAGYALLNVPGRANVTSVPSRFTVNGRTFPITYVATSDSERQTGLMNKEITNATTMLFIFPSSGVYSFWMYDTNSSLDIMWINATGSMGKVVYIVPGAPSCYLAFTCQRYTPSSPANYVLEARAGFAAANGIATGTEVQFA